LTKESKPFLVQRTCTCRSEVADEHGSHSLESYRNLPAYVLLGDPGSGKTEAFKRQATESGGEYIKARDFATFDPGEEYQGKTLFIDALDEMRADGGDGRTPLDHIRRHLERLECPSFRLSCRVADWLGASDSEALERVSPDGKVIALHLDPLTDDDIAEILRHKTIISNSDEFIRKALDHRLDELLRNPQTLNLLVEAVGGNEWPQSRKEIYEMACRQLVREPNPEHRKAKCDNVFPAETLLNAAGYLSATQLLSGIAGFSLDDERADKQYFCWNELTEHELPLLPALKTNLFQGDGEERRIPVHRSVAEYLGAYYLASRIENNGLPFGRVLALMTGADGGIVTDLRGLAAWLSVHCFSGRQLLIERDPLGVVLYGDVRNFPVPGKQLVLTALRNEAQRYLWFRSEDWSSSPFGALGTGDMVSAFREILTSPSREEADQALLDCVLDAIRYGEHLSVLADPLEAIARDSSYWPRVRRNAMQARMNAVPGDHSTLLKLTNDIHAGDVEDMDDEILGTLLDKLYPQTISPSQIFNYLHPQKNDRLTGGYSSFWSYRLPEAATKDDLPLLLDQLAQKLESIRESLQGYELKRMAGKLLIRGLEDCGDAITDKRLYEWLGVGLDEYAHPRLDAEYAQRIASWFKERPDRYKAMVFFGASLCAGDENVRYCMHRCTMRLYGSTPPADIGAWYLEMAVAEQDAELAGYYFTETILLLRQQGRQQELPLSALEFLESWIEAHPSFQKWLTPFITCPTGDWQQKHAIKDRTRKIKYQKQKSDWISYYRQHIEAIRDGSVHAKILHDLAQAYSGLLYEASGETPRERLEDFLSGDIELIEAAYAGFRHALGREDLPTVGEIVDLGLKGRMHYIRPACLVGMDELYQVDPSAALRLSDDVLSQLLAFRFTYDIGNDPAWFIALLHERPKMVTEALLAYAIPMLRKGREHIAGLSSLAYNDAYAEVARIALPVLLQGFPLRASKLRLSNILDPLIMGALRYLDRKILASLIALKLELKSMSTAQHVYWLGFGLLIDPDIYEAKLFQYIGKSAARKGYLVSFLLSRREHRLPDSASMHETTLARLIELLAPDSSPERPTGMHSVTLAMNTADMVRSFIDRLGGNSNKTATRELERLLNLPKLAPWHNHLRGALHTQRIARRKASFQRLNIEEVVHTLANLQPASAADLAALTFDHLLDIARKIRDGSTNDYRQYWSYGEDNKKLEKPKPENDCRDSLLSDLNDRLGRLGIDAQREGNYADDKRADIRVSFGGTNGFNVPIEIKKDNHRNLWRAIHEQLIAKYTRDPGADGYGIYLVFWFGGKGLPPPPDGSKKPRNAQELEERLRQTLSPEENNCILVCVIDCALP